MNKELWIIIGLLLAFILLILIVAYDVSEDIYIDDSMAKQETYKNG